MPEANRPAVAEFILEIRYQAFGGFLDLRGRFADRIKDELRFKHWRIDQNRVDFRNKGDEDEGVDTETAFVSFRNAGYVTLQPSTQNYFPDRSSHFLRTVMAQEGFVLNPITRLGVRGFFVIPYEGSFDQLKALYCQKMINQNLDSPGIMNGHIKDVGLTLDLEGNNYRWRVQSGPMEEKQMRSLLRSEAGFPSVGLYVDIDMYKQELGQLSSSELRSYIVNFNQTVWQKMSNISRAILVSD